VDRELHERDKDMPKIEEQNDPLCSSDIGERGRFLQPGEETSGAEWERRRKERSGKE